MSEIRLFQTPDGGEVTWKNGEPLSDEGLYTAVYLSLFGGNELDNGLTNGLPEQWWANFEEPVAARRHRSQTQAALRGIAATPSNLNRVEDAAMADLAWMTPELGAKVKVEAGMPGVDRVSLAVAIDINGRKILFDFDSKWSLEP